MTSYRVLARTWRPQKFSEVIGQDHIIQTLTNIISSDRIGHAYLFCGTRGVGKTSIARIFSKSLNCISPNGFEPCNECTNCKEISSSSSIDVMEIDGASNNGVNSIRELREQVSYLPTSGKYKIYIIDEVHMLSDSAFNALLKTLEEPPSRVLFMFATTEVYKIPATILSRCQRFNLRKVSRKEIFDHLKKITEADKISISIAGLNIISKEANGSIRDALSLLEQVVSFGGKDVDDKKVLDSIGIVDSNLIYRATRAIFENNINEILSVIQDINEVGHDCRTFLMGLISQIRNILVLKLQEKNNEINEKAFSDFIDLPEEEIQELRTIVGKLKCDRSIHRVFSIINESIPSILSSVLPLITLEGVLLRATTIKSSLSPQVLLEKIQDLENKVYRASQKSPENNIAPDKSLKKDNSSESNEENLTKNEAEISKWETLVLKIKKKKPLLAANIEEGTVLELTDNFLSLNYKHNSFSYKQVSDHENKNEIESILSEYFGNSFKINVSYGEIKDAKKKINLVEFKKEKMESDLNMIQDMAANHPNIKTVKDILDGKIIKVSIKEDNL